MRDKTVREAAQETPAARQTTTGAGQRCRWQKRLFDVGLVALAAPLLLPVLGALSLLVRLVDGAPTFFLQRRAGLGRRPFDIWKLRTMSTEADEASRRPTRLGAWLRHRGLDELPQVLNVLFGEMSLVGPRPLSLSDAERLVRTHPPFAERFCLPPGITGLAQVCQVRGAAITADLDLDYARRQSVALDVAILARTVWINVVGKRRGARPHPSMNPVSKPTPPRSPGVVEETLRALVQPKRLVPIAVVAAPLLVAQQQLSRPPEAFLIGLGLCLAFVFVAPLSWRVLFPEGATGPALAARLLLYAAIGCGVILSLGVALPRLLDIGPTFLTLRSSLAVTLALFLVGGWGLARDVSFEHRLERERARSEALAREAERAQLLALRAQLDPHFLFNTLNAIAEWCRQDGAVAERAVLQLAAMLRSVLDGVRAPTWPLEDELALVDALFALHLLRDASLFTLRREIDPALLQVAVPPLVLLPLAENAVKHGPSRGLRGELALVVRREGDALVVELENPGPPGPPREGSAGLPDLERRLALAYDGAARLELRPAGSGTRASLRLPIAGPREGVPA